MGYTALLFCPEEKTARTVTQVLGDLEFNVEACTEPFAAVKKLMGQHFDAIVVDCDNEQNATLLFKSARNSASNQTSLAVAVVEGQAGVAKAFRIGANLVLTKPINIEQSKGTLRVARGLLRKGEPAKGAATVASAPTAKPVTAKPAIEPKAEAKKEAPAPAPVFSAPAPEIQEIKPIPSWPATAATANITASVQDDDLLGIEAAEPISSAATVPAAASAITTPPSEREIDTKPARAGFSIFGSGAASAPAPAREAPEAKPSEATRNAADDAILDDSIGTPAEPAAVVGSTPSFTFGGATTESESRGGSKKILIGAAAAIIVAVGIYAGWVHFQATSEPPPNSETPVSSAPAAVSQPVKPSNVPASLPKSAAGSVQDSQLSKSPSPEKLQEEINAAAATNKSSGSSEKVSKADANEITEPAPLVVKGGKTPATKTKAADAPAPSLIGMATPGASVPPPNLVTSTEPAFKPTLQTLNISQGVSQGLLIKKVPPSYPSNALRMHIEGAVELTATISKAGLISQIKVLSGDPQLTKAATDAVKQWKYKPYLLNGEPVEIQTQITINFKLPH